jgi:arylsulfatase A-like enzyme
LLAISHADSRHLAVAADGTACAEQTRQPNILLVMTDDQGYGDLACHGNPLIQTPHIDAFYKQAVRFTDFHVSPTCSPTRSALMTGRHEFKNGVTHTINERERLTLLAFTLAQLLKSAGYTTGIFGKWHLGDEADHQPNRRGFDEVFIHGAGGIGQTYVGSCGDAPGNTYFNPAILHNGTFEKTKGYCTDVFFAQATAWIDQQCQAGRPFFAYITPNAPHAPLDCPPDYEAKYTGKVPANVAKFYGMITNIDDNFGRLMDKLRRWRLERDTLVIFMTDNGSATGSQTFNAGMRGAKGTPYQGGTRVPALWRWPAGFAGGRDVKQLTAHIDIFPTLAAITEAKVPPEFAGQVEGRSLLPLLEDDAADWPDRTLVTHVGRWEKGQAAAAKYSACSIRNSRFTLVNAKQRGEQWELFDLQSDPGETKNVLAEHRDIADELRDRLDQWWTEVTPLLVNEDAVGPAQNPFKVLYWKQFGGGPKELVP